MQCNAPHYIRTSVTPLPLLLALLLLSDSLISLHSPRTLRLVAVMPCSLHRTLSLRACRRLCTCDTLVFRHWGTRHPCIESDRVTVGGEEEN
ncbi:hypothetical protein BDV97DRAFT_179650 [Delphinella strobiligena]|nr:hypothetical protein BDV97DRAFT_179650 [Delphinella strobiligena]